MDLSPRSPNFFFNFERRSWPTQKKINFSPPAFSAPQGARPRPASASTGAPGQGRPCEPSGLLRTAGARQNGWGKATRRGARAQARGHTRGRPDNAEGGPRAAGASRGRPQRRPERATETRQSAPARQTTPAIESARAILATPCGTISTSCTWYQRLRKPRMRTGGSLGRACLIVYVCVRVRCWHPREIIGACQ